MDEALRTYIRVVELQSFTKAAEELHISQPAVSLQLKKLEEIYETELIYRQAKKFILTATGEILYHRAKQLEGLYKQVEDEISLYHHHLKGRLRIGASFTIGEYFLPEVIAKFHALYPDITIELIIENTAKIADKVELLQVDTGLIEGQVSKKDLEISAFRMMRCVSLVEQTVHLPKSNKEQLGLREKKAQERVNIWIMY